MGDTCSLPPGAGTRQHHASVPCADACAGSSAPSALAERSSQSCPSQHCDEQCQQHCDEQCQHQQHQQQHPAASEAPAQAGAVAAAPVSLPAPACTDAPAANEPCSLTLYELQQRLQGCGCDQGLAALWDLAHIFSQTEGPAAAGDAGQMSAQELLQFTTDPHQLQSFKEQLGAAEPSEDYGRTANYLHGLQQLLSQPVVAAVLGWDSDHQQQQLADVRSLCSRCQAAAADQQQQQQRIASATNTFPAQGAAGCHCAACASEAAHRRAHAAPEPSSAAGVTAGAAGEDAGGAPDCDVPVGQAPAPALAAAAAATLAAAAPTPRPAHLLVGTRDGPTRVSNLTVNTVSTPGHALRSALRKWVQACGSAGDPGRVRVAELLPHYATLLSLLDDLHSSSQLSASTIHQYLTILCTFLRGRRQALQSSSVNYAAMLSSLGAASSKYRRTWMGRGQTAHCLDSGKDTAAASTASAVAPQTAQEHRSHSDVAAAAAAPAAAASAAVGPASSAGLADSVMPEAAAMPKVSATGAAGSSSSDVEAWDAAAAASILISLQQQEQTPLGYLATDRMPAAAGAAATATTEQQPPGMSNTLTVSEVGCAGHPLRVALRKWVQACGIAGDSGSVRVAELLPQYASLLVHLESQHSSRQLMAATAYHYLSVLRSFLKDQQRALQCSSVDYAAMLRSMDTACSTYRQMVPPVKKKGQEPSSLGGRKSETVYAASAAAPQSAQQRCGSGVSAGGAAGLAGGAGPSPPSASAAAAAAAAAARFAAAWFADGADPAQLIGTTWPQAGGATGPEAAAAAGDDAAPLAAAAAAAMPTAGAARGSSSGDGPLAAAAAAAAGAAVDWEVFSMFTAGSTGAYAADDDQEAISSGLGQSAAAAAAASTPTATPEQLSADTPSTLTVNEVSVHSQLLRRGLNRWVQACGIVYDPGSVCAAELLPHYASLLNDLGRMYSSKQLQHVTVCQYLSALCSFLRGYQQVLQSSSVDYAAMLSSMDAARSKYQQLATNYYGSYRSTGGKMVRGKGQGPNSKGGRKHKAAAAAVSAVAGLAGTAVPDLACTPAAAAAPSGCAAGFAAAQLCQQQTGATLLLAAEAAASEAAAAGAAADPAASAGLAGDVGPYSLAAPAASAAASSAAAAGPGEGPSVAQLSERLGTATWPQEDEALCPDTAAAAALCRTAPQAAAAMWADGEDRAGAEGAGLVASVPYAAAVSNADGMWEGSNAAAAAAAAAAFTGYNISIADLLQQLQSDPSVGADLCATCTKQLRDSAACFGGVALDAIPASLLLTNYIAEVGDRAQQCLSTAGQQDRTAAGARAECLAVMQEVEGLLQISGQPVLLQLLGGQRLQDLVGGLVGCKQLLGDQLRSLNVLTLCL